jgi:hypothetical protein
VDTLKKLILILLIIITLSFKINAIPPELPTIFFGPVVDEEMSSLADVKVAALWEDNDGNPQMTITHTLTNEEARFITLLFRIKFPC